VASRPTSVPSGIFIHAVIWLKQTWAENWGLCPFGGSWAPSNTSTSLLSGILIHPAVWPQQTWAKIEGFAPLGSHLTQCGQGQAYLHNEWHLDLSSRLTTTDMGQKSRRGAVPLLFEGGAGSPSNTMWPGSRLIPPCQV